MRFVVAAVAAGAVYLVISLPRPQRITVRVGDYLNPARREPVSGPLELPLRWIQGEDVAHRAVAAAAGVLVGLLLGGAASSYFISAEASMLRVDGDMMDLRIIWDLAMANGAVIKELIDAE